MRSFLAVLSLAPLPSLLVWVVVKISVDYPPKTDWQIRLYQLCCAAAIFGFLLLQFHVARVTGILMRHRSYIKSIFFAEWIMALIVFTFSYYQARKRKS